MTSTTTSKQADSQWVVIVSDNAPLSRDLVERWQTERDVPEFTSMTSELWQVAALVCEGKPAAVDPPPIAGFDYDLAIVCGVAPDQLTPTLRLVPIGTPVVALLPPEISPRQIRSEFAGVLPIRHNDYAVETAVMAGAELLRRSVFQKRLFEAEKAIHNSQLHAVLGRYMLESRHSFNNALTSVLGTSELMQLSGLHPLTEAREQVKTIHMMALRLQALMQRFSAIEAETKMSERQARTRAEVLPFHRRRRETPAEVLS